MILSVQVKPNSRKDEICLDSEGILKVKIKAPPVDGKANKYLIDFLAGVFEVPKSAIEIQKGTTAKYKRVEVLGDETKLKQKIVDLTI